MAPRRRPLRLLLLPQLLAGCCLAYDNGAPNSRFPPMGWSSWVALSGDPAGCGHAFDYCSDRSVRQAAQDFHTVGLYDAGYVSPRPPSAAPLAPAHQPAAWRQRHLHLDDCWAGTVNKTGHNGGRNATGYLEPDRHLFPSGMAALVDYVHSLNLSFGLYTCAGNFTCIGKRPGSGGPYDPKTGITHHVNYARDAATFASWGVVSAATPPPSRSLSANPRLLLPL